MGTLIAIDGGNSKTEVLVCDTSGVVLGYARGRGSNHQTAGGVDEAMSRLAHLVATARERAGLVDHEPATLAAVYLAALDNLDGAFQAVAEMVDRNPRLLDELGEDPAVEQLVADPRWAALRELSS